VCAEGKKDKAFAIVRTQGTFEAWTQNRWIVEGFALLTPGDCIDLHFGEDQSASVGYLAVLDGLFGVWDTARYEDSPATDQDREYVLTPTEKWICWPSADDAASTVDPNATCNDPVRRVRFNFTYSTHGLITGLTLFLKDDGIRSSWTRTMFSPRVP